MNIQEHTSLSAIIRTKNSEKTILKCLQSLEKQTVKPNKVIAVDSGSTDLTLEILNQFQVTVLEYPKGEPFNYSRALNFGIEKSETDLLLIISSHVELISNHHIQIMIQVLMSWNKIKSVSSELVKEKIQCNTNYENLDWILFDRYSFNGYAMYNPCALIRKKDWVDYRFNESMPTCEDQDWAKHYISLDNNVVIILINLVAHYNNPYYNIWKDIREFLVIGRYVFPPLVSNTNLLIKAYKAVRIFFRGDLRQSISELMKVLLAFYDKKIKNINLNTIYNKKLN